ncbi:hypothetical protein BIV25_28695 [Streptomyces sp. MUSC 14]|nr:hypothetical protein BIV25_28695 [Streptomyces sp. MUSC 14]
MTAVPDRTHRLRTEASPALWVTVTEPAMQFDDGLAVAVPLGDEDAVTGGAAVDDGADDEAGGAVVPVPFPDGVVECGSAEGRAGAESDCEPPPLLPQAVRRQATATEAAANHGRVCPGLRRPCSTTVTTASSHPRTPL